jgi:thioesterase domain-containing protein
VRGNPVIDFHPDEIKPPLFWFHGDFSQGGYYIRRFAKLLGPEQPVTSIAPHGVNNEPIPGSIEAMALDRLPLILERQPKGPYRIGGYCNGALVAFEAARLLVKAGHKVEMLAMIDPAHDQCPSLVAAAAAPSQACSAGTVSRSLLSAAEQVRRDLEMASDQADEESSGEALPQRARAAAPPLAEDERHLGPSDREDERHRTTATDLFPGHGSLPAGPVECPHRILLGRL